MHSYRKEGMKMFDMELRDYTNWDVQSVFKRDRKSVV